MLIPLAVVWVGYAGIWYGIQLLKGPGIGLLDLIKPSQIGKVDAAILGQRIANDPVGGGNWDGSPVRPAK